MSDFDLPMEFGKKASSSSRHHSHQSSETPSQHHPFQQHSRGGRGRGGARGGGGRGHAHHHNNRRFSGHKRPFVGGRGGGSHHFSNQQHHDDGDDVSSSVARYFSPAMLHNPWRAWLEPDAVVDDGDAMPTPQHESVVPPAALLHDLLEYTSEASQRRILVRVSGPFDAGVEPVVALDAGDRLLRVSVAAASLHADQVDTLDQLFSVHTGHDRLRREALLAFAGREGADWSYTLALPTTADSESLTTCLLACPVRDSTAAQRLLFVDVGVREAAAAADRDDVESSPIEPQSPPPETETETERVE